MSFLIHVIGNSIVCIPISIWKTSVVIGSDLKLGPTVAVTVLLLYKFMCFILLIFIHLQLWLLCLQCWMYCSRYRCCLNLT